LASKIIWHIDSMAAMGKVIKQLGHNAT
jgi:hypothetical protein